MLSVLLFAALVAAGETLDLPRWLAFLTAFGLTLPAALWGTRTLGRPLTRTLEALTDGIRGFRDRDFSLRLAPKGGGGLADLVDLYNRVGEILLEERSQLRQRELLLQVALDQSPVAIVLVNPLDRVVYANHEARRLFSGGGRLQGLHFAELLDAAPRDMRRILDEAQDGIFSVAGRDGEIETYHLSHRHFVVNRQPHRLVLLRRMTMELARQEADIWKRIIRIISHEINNSLAPIASLAHSGGLLARGAPDPARLESVHAAIRDRVEHLTRFLEGYARYARLPAPSKQRVDWGEWLQGPRRLYDFDFAGEPPAAPGWFDPAQIAQVLINLLKNAREAADGDAPIEVGIVRLPDGGWLVQVLDRGRGMDDDVLRQALLPFYSTKPSGAGVGLPLSREIVEAHGGTLRIQSRPGGGTIVGFRLPPGPDGA